MFEQQKSPSYTLTSEKAAAASQLIKEQEYWQQKFSGPLVKTEIPYDQDKTREKSPATSMESVLFDITGTLWEQVLKLSNGNEIKMHMILTAVLQVLIYKHTGSRDIVIGTPVYRQQTPGQGEFLNTVLALRTRVEDEMTFKQLLQQVKTTIKEADQNQNYPLEALIENVDIQTGTHGHPLFGIALVLENIQEKKHLKTMDMPLNIIFSLRREENGLKAEVEYNPAYYYATTIERVCSRCKHLLGRVLTAADQPLAAVEILEEQERQQLLSEFNRTEKQNRYAGTIPGLFAEQAARTPDSTALIGQNPDQEPGKGQGNMTYKELHEKSNRLAHFLQGNGVATETVVGIMMEPSNEMVTGLMAILKAGGAYMPMEPGLPAERVEFMLADTRAAALLTTTSASTGKPFTRLQGFANRRDIRVTVTRPRPHIEAFDQLPRPDRTLIDLRNYKNKIGMASVTNCISLQSTRGCPYQCLYCHKIWSKHHVHRSAGNLYDEIEYYNRQGVTDFAFIDDCFNLNTESSRELFRQVIKNKLPVRFFFPNGMRGDIMTPGYIDLMVEAGTRGINLSLETASPRLQKLLKKNLDLEKFQKVIEYIAAQHPGVILEMASMHGFPGESQEEAMMTLEFIKNIKWLHFPYIHILKIYPNTEMEAFALEQGISKEDIMKSKDRAFHELPETLPFPKSFTRKFQADFLNNYFLDQERLKHVLPHQMEIFNETALIQKYNAYLPVEIKSLADITAFAQIQGIREPGNFTRENRGRETIFDRAPAPRHTPPEAKRILFLDLSQHFSTHRMLYSVVEQPLGLISLLTYIKKQYGDQIDGRIYKSGTDFDNYRQLQELVEAYRPDLVGIRTLTFFQEFFHETVSLLRQWGLEAPIVTGGPYASSDYDTLLKDTNVDLVVLGEGEETLAQLLGEMLKNEFKLPGTRELDKIPGIVYRQPHHGTAAGSRQIILMDLIKDALDRESFANPRPAAQEHNLAYVMYTSGTAGKPKGVMVEHRQVNNNHSWMQDRFNLGPGHVIVNRTNITFDPSVWEISWPLYTGAGVKVLDTHQRKDAEFLLRLMSEDPSITMMYCPASMVKLMTSLLNARKEKPRLKLPWLIIGAEPIGSQTIKDFYRCYEGRIVNTYGPTEATINNTYIELNPGDIPAPIPIGKPIANNKIYILDKNMRLTPLKIPGEICIAGASVARGYMNRREEDQQAFRENPFAPGKLYKTGDIGRWLEDGTIEIRGRLDEQVKIRGYRIEMTGIEKALISHPDIRDCVVLARDTNQLQEKTRECKKCGIWSNYPGISINNRDICNICENMERYQNLIEQYFLTPPDLENKIKEGNKDRNRFYDCLLVYACERVATYALYRLKEMGLNLLTVTYDSGHYNQASLDRITAITKQIGVDHLFLHHERSNDILKESLRTAQTMCKGCIHTSTTLAGEYAYKHGIKFVIGETLSRGQIVENKLQKFIDMGVKDVTELETEIRKLQRNTALIDKKIFDIIGSEIFNRGTVYDEVEFIDFYRYIDVTNQEMIRYLEEKDRYWQDLDTKAIYSTDCKICQVGNFNYLKEKGYHYTGSAKSWDLRLGLTSQQDLQEDLKIPMKEEEYNDFLQELGYRPEPAGDTREKHICAYIAAGEELTVTQIRQYLADKLPHYMVPGYFIFMKEIPVDANGKIDRKALPGPEGIRPKLTGTYVAPKTDLEKVVGRVWQEVLKVDMAGVEDNFFDLGGSSLDIVIMGNRIKEEIHREIPVVTLFTYPTIRSLTRHLQEKDTAQTPPDGEIDRTGTVEKGKNMMKQGFKKIGKN